MPFPTTQTIAQLQQNFIAAWVSDLAPQFGITAAGIPQGDPIQAIAFATAGATNYLQSYIQALVLFSRASTATGADLDSWLADFGYTRAPGVAAQAWVKFAMAPLQVAGAGGIQIPAGTQVQTLPLVIGQSTVPAVYSFTTNQAATIPAGSSSVTVLCAATAVGSAANQVPATATLQMSSNIAGISSAVFAPNPSTPSGSAAPSGGQDAATDAAARTGFVEFITNLSRATLGSIEAAVEDVDGGLVLGQTFAVLDAATAPDLLLPGQVAIVYLDPSESGGQYTGSPDNTTADAILAAVQSVEAFSITAQVWFAFTYEVTGVTLSLTASQGQLNAAGLSQGAFKAALETAIDNIFDLAMGQRVPFVGANGFLDQIANFSYVNPSGVTISGLVTEIDASTALVVVTVPAGRGGGTQNYQVSAGPYIDMVYSGQTDPFGVLRPGASPTFTLTIAYGP